ncbi:MAG: hypothetical protein ABI868_23930 [Acidobacteriota bacterium]
MPAKLIASWLVVLAVLPFTAPFSTFTLADVWGTRPARRFSLVDRSVSAAPAPGPDLAINLTTKNVRPVAATRVDSRPQPAVLPATVAAIAPLRVGRRLVPPHQDFQSTVTRPLTVLRR